MNKIVLLIGLLLPLLLCAESLSVLVSLEPLPFDQEKNCFNLKNSKYGAVTAPGMYQLPVRTINLVLPPGAIYQNHSISLAGQSFIFAPEPIINPAFSSSDGLLYSTAQTQFKQQTSFKGIQKWGDIQYASFQVLPASYDPLRKGYSVSEQVQIQLEYLLPKDTPRNCLPPTLRDGSYFDNPQDLHKFYRQSSQLIYDYLVVSTPQLYSAASELISFRESQGLECVFADIDDVLDSSQGLNPAEKLRNYLIQQYAVHPFCYLLLIGDLDTVPVAMLTPEPDGFDTIPSDFYYSDLSSIFDTDGDDRLGEYSFGEGDQDWLVDFTPELFVGRISTNSTNQVTAISSRIVAYEQSSAAWKNKALLPAAFLNYQNEGDEANFLQTDGADYMELIKATIINDMQSTSLYEQTGVVPSHPSDYDLDSSTLRNLLDTQSYGILNWSAHGSATSSSRKVWLEDINSNGIPESYEMEWMGLVNRNTFDNLGNDDGMVVFCASCYNGMIDHTSESLAEYVLIKKGVATIGATRTGWYKIGWINPGWGGLSSYNYHWLENFRSSGFSVGGAHAYANLLHSQYYLFGDPIDTGGIIWPELQNIYTYLLFGDPAIGHTPEPQQSSGEILVWEPYDHNGLNVVNAINELGNYNVIYTDKLIPEYQYLENFEAIFCLWGYGNTSYQLDPESFEYSLLNSYLEEGGRLYLEGAVNWDDQDPFWAKFGTIAPYDHLAYIEDIGWTSETDSMRWTYATDDRYTQALAVFGENALPLFYSHSTEYISDVIAVLNSDGDYTTIASSFQLACVTEPENSLVQMIELLLNLEHEPPDANHDPEIPRLQVTLNCYPNPTREGLHLELKNYSGQKTAFSVFNLRGQKIFHSSENLFKNDPTWYWNSLDQNGKRLPSGIYMIKVDTDQGSIVQKVLLLK